MPKKSLELQKTKWRFHHISASCLFSQQRKEASREVFNYDLFLRKAQVLVQEEWHVAVMFTEASSVLCKVFLFQPLNVA